MQRNLFLLFALAILVVACKKTDTTPPVIVVFEQDYRVPLGGIYLEKGALATDKEDGVMDTALITIDASRVRTDSVGEYEVYYYVSDAAGNEDSATRVVAVYARTLNYAGNWSVRDSCDTIISNYAVTVATDPLDSTRLLVANWRNRGAGYTVGLTVEGRLGNSIQVNDTLPDFTYFGSTVLLYGTLDRFAFDLTFDEIDTVAFTTCTSQYRKP